MPLLAVTYRYTDEPGRLGQHRPARLDWFRRLDAEGTLLASGQLVDGDLADGLLVLDAPDAATAEALLDEDPFVIEGLVTDRRVARWHATVGAWTR